MAVVGCGRIGIPPLQDAGAAAVDLLAGPPADVCSFGDWMVAVNQPFGMINSAYSDWGVEASRDGLRLVFSSNRPDPAQQSTNYDLYYAERATTAEAFGEPVRLSISSDTSDDADPALSNNGQELYFVRDCIYVATRGAAGGPNDWNPPQRLSNLCPLDASIGGPFLSKDGQRLYYDVKIGLTTETWMATRRADGFTQVGVSVGAPDLRYIALDDDELTLYGEHDAMGTPTQLWRATRSSTNDPFPAGAVVDGLGDGFDHGDPSLTSDGLHLVYARNLNGVPNTSEILMAERSCQ